MHKKMVGDEDDGDEDHDKDGSYKTPPQQQQQHLNQSKLTALVADVATTSYWIWGRGEFCNQPFQHKRRKET